MTIRFFKNTNIIVTIDGEIAGEIGAANRYNKSDGLHKVDVVIAKIFNEYNGTNHDNLIITPEYDSVAGDFTDIYDCCAQGNMWKGTIQNAEEDPLNRYVHILELTPVSQY